jgi:uncharacterized protein (UPF0332 family)
MNPREFLGSALRLATSTEEADWRSAVSRAYYAAFHVACQLMEGFGFTVPNADRAHGYLWLRLQNCGDAPVETAGRDLNDLRSERNRADYNLRRPINQRRTQALTGIAQGIIQTLDTIVEPTRSQIINAMKLYDCAT